ncbi:intracellular hyaluronan-binding protein 4 [Kryptolebias marmoratus]|uniref:Hyaluronan binding protein 4 n=1 Tax=Kryptolebias marmoratus TaxID=37003 RepID=A0A3Q2ZC93_KRYMA|nr:intracellular hyaluronan-binding protein 4 [Kryptolebias marmoratus]
MLPDAFGCAVANRFGDLLLDDDAADPFDLMSEVELEKEKKKKKKKKEEEGDKKGKQKKPGHKESQRDRRVPVASDGPDPAPVGKQQAAMDRDGRSEAPRSTRRAAAGQRRANQDQPSLDFSVPKSSYDNLDFSGRGGMRGRRGTRGGGHPRSSENFYQRGKREHDRHDGTGFSTEEKRGGRGPWNWGCVEEVASELMETTSAAAAVKSEEPQMPLEEENPNQAMDEDNEMVVQVAMEMTLDEWKALQEMSRPKAEFNIRKAEDKIPSKAKVIHQSKYLENPKEVVEEMEDDGNFFRRSVNDITTRLDINFGSLGRPSRGGRGRGAQGGQSMCSERAKPTFDREEDLAPNPDDPEDFPALSAGK